MPMKDKAAPESFATSEQADAATRNFIIDEARADLEAGRYERSICTRFPPEPNGYMHLGHAKAATVNFDVAQAFSGHFNLRLDDTNPAAEESEYAEAMIEDVRWLLGCDLGNRVFHASDYFAKLYDYAVALVRKGLAYVDDLSLDQIREYRGNYYKPGRPSPFRERSVEENLQLFSNMRQGHYAAGEKVLRAKIDPQAANMNMRDPLMYRIMQARHHRAGDWHIYPLYDYAHPLSDAIEGVTHSICGKEFANHRPLYEWFLEQLELPQPPRQIEFAEIGIDGVVLAKRHLRKLVDSSAVHGWDDPRLPTIRGLRRRGYPAAAICAFCRDLGVSSSSPGSVDQALLQHHVREHLNKTSPRYMAVLRPLKVTVENYPEEKRERFEAMNLPGDESYGVREINFGRTFYIERGDFMEDPPKKYHRLAPGKEVRLRSAYYVTCTEVIKDARGTVTELRVTYDPQSRGGSSPDGRKVKGTLHWVCAESGVPIEIRNYENLFSDSLVEFDGKESIERHLNPNSLEIVPNAIAEANVTRLEAGDRIQFERLGYYCVDPDSSENKLVFNRTVKLRDSKFAKIFRQ